MKKKILVKNGRALIDEDGKILSSSTIGNIPTGKIEITTTEEIDVSKYETAQVVDENLTAENIAKDVNILGVVGTFEGGSSENKLNQLLNKTITEVTLADLEGVTEIPQDLFYNINNFTKIELPNSITEIGQTAFNKNSTKEKVYFYGTIDEWCNIYQLNGTSINAFGNPISNATMFYVKDTNGVFYEVNETVNINNATLINNGAFASYNNIKQLILKSVTTLNKGALSYCNKLTDIYVGVNQVVTLSHTHCFFGLTGKGIKIHVRSEYAEQYATATNWSSLIADGTIVVVGDYTEA